MATLFISLAVLGIIVGSEVFAPRFPGALLAVIGMTAASAYFHWGDHGVTIVGKVPSGLPRLGLPEVTWSDVMLILPIALSSLERMGLLQLIGANRIFDSRHACIQAYQSEGKS